MNNQYFKGNSQAKRLYKYLKENGGITVRECFFLLGIQTPTQRIAELRQHGINVVSEKIDGTNAVRYVLKEGEYGN